MLRIISISVVLFFAAQAMAGECITRSEYEIGFMNSRGRLLDQAKKFTEAVTRFKRLDDDFQKILADSQNRNSETKYRSLRSIIRYGYHRIAQEEETLAETAEAFRDAVRTSGYRLTVPENNSIADTEQLAQFMLNGDFAVLGRDFNRMPGKCIEWSVP